MATRVKTRAIARGRLTSYLPTLRLLPMVISTWETVTVRATYYAILWTENFSVRSASPGRVTESFRLLTVFGSILAERRLFLPWLTAATEEFRHSRLSV